MASFNELYQDFMNKRTAGTSGASPSTAPRLQELYSDFMATADKRRADRLEEERQRARRAIDAGQGLPDMNAISRDLVQRYNAAAKGWKSADELAALQRKINDARKQYEQSASYYRQYGDLVTGGVGSEYADWLNEMQSGLNAMQADYGQYADQAAWDQNVGFAQRYAGKSVDELQGIVQQMRATGEKRLDSDQGRVQRRRDELYMEAERARQEAEDAGYSREYTDAQKQAYREAAERAQREYEEYAANPFIYGNDAEINWIQNYIDSGGAAYDANAIRFGVDLNYMTPYEVVTWADDAGRTEEERKWAEDWMSNTAGSNGQIGVEEFREVAASQAVYDDLRSRLTDEQLKAYEDAIGYYVTEKNTPAVGVEETDGGVPQKVRAQTEVDAAVRDYAIAAGISEDEARRQVEEGAAYLTSKEVRQYRESMAAWAGEHPLMGTLATVATRPVDNMAAAIKVIEGYVTGEAPRSYDAGMAGYITNEAMRQEAGQTSAEALAKLGLTEEQGRWVYNALVSTADSAVNMLLMRGAAGIVGGGVAGNIVSGIVSNAVMGSGAAVDTYISGRREGLGDYEVLIKSILAGAIEGVTEAIGGEKIWGEIKGSDTAIEALLKSFMSEGTEEFASNMLNRMVANGIKLYNQERYGQAQQYEMGPLAAAVGLLLGKYTQLGYSDKDAFLAALTETLKEDASAFLAGGFSGLLMSGVGRGVRAVGTAVNDYSTGRSMIREGYRNAPNVRTINEGLEMSGLKGNVTEKTGSYQMGRAVRRATETRTQTNAVRAVREATPQIRDALVRQGIRQEMADRAAGPMAKQMVMQLLQERGANVNEKLAQVLELDDAEAELLQRGPMKAAYENVAGISENASDKTVSGAYDIMRKILTTLQQDQVTGALLDKESAAQIQKGQDPGRFAADKRLTVAAAKQYGVEQREAGLAAAKSQKTTLTDEQVEAIYDRAARNVETAKISEDGKIQLPDGVSTRGIQAIKSVFYAIDKADTSAREDFSINALGTYNLALGYGGTKYAQAVLESVQKAYPGISQQLQEVFDRGLQERRERGLYVAESQQKNTVTDADRAARKAGTITADDAKKYGVNTVDFDRIEEINGRNGRQMAQQAVRMAQRLSRVLNVNIVFFDSRNAERQLTGNANGWFDRASGTVYLDITSGLDNGGSVTFTLAHELTHVIAARAQSEFQAMEDFIVDYYYKNRGGREGYVKEIQAIMGTDASIKTEDDAREELVARSCENMLTDTQAIRTLYQQNRKLFGVISRAVDRFVRAFNKVVQWMQGDTRASSRYARALDESAEALRKMQELWDAGLVAAAQRGDAEAREAMQDAAEIGASAQMAEEAIVKNSSKLDQETLDFLDNQEHVTVYRAMQVIDGKLYPPMAAQIRDENGKLQYVEPTEIGQWYQAVERPDLLDKNGKFVLNKGNGTNVPAAYNPYFHSSASPLNDQFSSAWKRPNLVVVEGEIPASELTSGYRAQGAKNTVGETKWHSGPVASKLKGDKARRVFLSRWFRVNRIMTDAEVADIVAETLQGENVKVPSNVVTPGLLAELRQRGVPIEEKNAAQGGVKFSSKNFEYMKPFAEQLKDFMDKEHRKEVFGDDALLIGPTPKILQDIGLIRLPVVIRQDHVSYALEGSYTKKEEFKKGHIYGITEFSKLPEKLADPVAIIADPSKHDLVIYVEMTNNAGDQTIVPFRVSTGAKLGGRKIEVQRAKSVFGDEDAESQLISAIENDRADRIRLHYINKEKIPSKTSQTVQSHGFSVPSGIIHSVNDPGSLVKQEKNSQTETTQFKNWFGNSKAVRNGKPLLLYHYTNAEGIEVFDVGRSGSNQGTTHGDGIYLSSSPTEYAYAGKNRMELYAAIRHPFEMQLTKVQAQRIYDDYFRPFHDDPHHVYEPHVLAKLQSPLRVFDYLKEAAEKNNTTTSAILSKIGFDGVHDGSVWVAFKPTQVKSATDNIGLFDPDNPNIKFSSKASDADYLSAVERGDMETAQRMVDEAAERALAESKIRSEDGRLLKVYHGTSAEFTVFDTTISGGKNGVQEGFGIYLSDARAVADQYGGRVIESYANIKRPATTWNRTINLRELQRLIQKTCERQAQEMVAEDEYENVQEALPDTWISNYVYTPEYSSIRTAYRDVASKILEQNDDDWSVVNEVMSGLGIRDYEAANQFYDEDLTPTTGIDGFWTKWANNSNVTGKPVNVILAFHSSQIKSADPVTYDDTGKPIPLSERFNTGNEDIRYSAKGLDSEENPDYTALLKAEKNYNSLMEVLNGDNRKSGNKRTTLRNQGEEYGRLREIYEKDRVTSAKERDLVCNALREAGALSSRKVKVAEDEFYGDVYATVDVVPEKYYTKEMVAATAKIKGRGFNTAFIVGKIRVEDGTTWGVNGFADTDSGTAYVRYDATNKSDSRVNDREKNFAKYQGIQAAAQNADHELLHLLRYSHNAAADALFHLVDDENGPFVKTFDGINYWYQAKLRQEGYGFHDYSEEIAADLYSGNLHLDDPKIRAAVEPLIRAIDEGQTPKFSQKDRSDEEILAAANPEAAKTPKERKELTEYKEKLREMWAAQNRREEAMKEVRRLLKSTDPDEVNRRHSLQRESNRLKEQIAALRSELLQRAKKEALRSVLSREREAAYNAAAQRGRERLQRYRIRRDQSEAVKKYRGQIEGSVKDLLRLVTENSDKRHVPDQLRQPLAEFLQSIDLESAQAAEGGPATRRDQDWARRFERLTAALNAQRADELEGKSDANLYLPDDFYELMNKAAEAVRVFTERYGGTELYGSDAETLRDLSKVLQILNHAVKEANSTMVNRYAAKISELAELTMEQLRPLGTGKTMNRAEGWLNNLILWQNGTPYYVFKRFGEAGFSTFQAIMDGQGKLAAIAEKVINDSRQMFTSEEVKDWQNEVHEVELSNDRMVRMTTAQLMSFYCLSKRQQAVGHLLGGGMKIDAFKDGRRTVDDRTDYVLGVEDIQTINGLLTDRQREVADAIQRYMSTYGSELGNEVSMRRFGYKAYGEANYFPIVSDRQNLDGTKEEEQRASLLRLLNMSHTKSLVDNANNALVVQNIFDVFSSHMSDMAEYNALALPVLDMVRWFNYKNRQDAGNGQIVTDTVQKSLATAFGGVDTGGGNVRLLANEYVKTFLKDLNGNNERGRDIGIGNLMGKYKRASVAANLRVAIQQPMSIMRASAVLDPKWLAKGIADAAKAPRELSEELSRYSNEAKWKDQGHHDIYIGRSVAQQIKNDQSVWDRAVERSMVLAEIGDKVTWTALWAACKAEQQGNGLSGEALMDATARRFQEVVYATQVMDATTTRSQSMRSNSHMNQMWTAFMAEPTLSVNLLADSFMQWRLEARRGGDTTEARKKAFRATWRVGARAIAAYAFNALAVTLAESLIDAFRDDDDYETFVDKYLSALGENWMEELNPLSKVTVLKDVLNIFTSKYGAGDRMDLAALTSAKKSIDIMVETYKVNVLGEDPTETTYYGKMTWYGKAYQLLKTVSQITGVPFAGLSREMQSVWNNMFYPGLKAAGVNDVQRLKTYAESAKNVGIPKLYEALAAGREEEAIKLRTEMYYNGVEDKYITEQLKAQIKEHYTAGDIEADEAERLLVEYCGFDPQATGGKSLQYQLDKWEYGSDYKMFSGVEEAFRLGSADAVRQAVQEQRTRYFRQNRDIKADCTEYWKEQFQSGAASRDTVKRMLTATGLYTAEDIDKLLKKWQSA